jgi:hypothetical protein
VDLTRLVLGGPDFKMRKMTIMRYVWLLDLILEQLIQVEAATPFRCTFRLLTLAIGVAYATPSQNVAILDEIELVTNWGYQMSNTAKVPSVISYSPSSRDQHGEMFEQWGHSVSEGAVAIINVKLQLDVDSVSDELNTLRSILDGTKDFSFEYIKASKGRPDYPWKGPEAIVTDYLKRVFGYLSQTVDNFARVVRSGFPTDIVATIPTVRSHSILDTSLT